MVLYFTATWCGPCKAFKPVVQQVDVSLGLGINYIDVDQQPEIARKYNISSVPTIIVVSGNDVVFRQTGAVPVSKLVQMLSQYK